MTHGLVCTIIPWDTNFINHFVQGVTGYEGAFRKSCEATMKVLRQDSDALIWYVCVCLVHNNFMKQTSFHKPSVLKTFIHDPLVEWEKVKGRPASAEATNEKVIH